MGSLCSGVFGKNLKTVALVMAGGVGARFWPLSRKSQPKQFLNLAGGDESLIQNTVNRLSGLVQKSGVLVVTGKSLAPLVRQHLPESVVMSEPIARNTAPCLGLGAIKVLSEVGDVPMICLPADHLVIGHERMRDILSEAANLAAREDVLITMGIKPAYPETGYGYIQRGREYAKAQAVGLSVYQVREFKEKPSHDIAKEYVSSGDYYWNSGMFVMRPSVLLKAMAEFMPDLSNALAQIKELLPQEAQEERIAEIFSKVSSVSIDIGIFEKAKNVLVFPGEGFKWSDIGSWASWAEEMRNQQGEQKENVWQGDVELIKSSQCAVMGGHRLVALVGVQDLVVVDTNYALLICHKDKTQDVKKIVDSLKAKGREDLL